jgi:hypothetical protein
MVPFPESSQFLNAKEMIMKPSTIAKTLTIAAVTALALGIAPIAKADDKGCSEATLKGHHFAYTSTGSLVAAPIPPSVWGPYAEVGVQYFDGKGGVSFTYNASVNGSVGPGTATGTYTVKDDCTGTFTEDGGGISSQFNFVIDHDGTEFQAICQDPGAVITRIGRRQYLEGDWRR